jgi:hypothetical protein
MSTQKALAAVGIAVLAAGSWFGWMGWDHTYQYDAAGQASGPYEAWQVAGCVLTLAVLAAAGALLVSPWLTALLVTVPFTAAWIATAAPSDDTGLWAVGAILVLGALAAGSAVVAYGAYFARAAIRHAAGH